MQRGFAFEATHQVWNQHLVPVLQSHMRMRHRCRELDHARIVRERCYIGSGDDHPVAGVILADSIVSCRVSVQSTGRSLADPLLTFMTATRLDPIGVANAGEFPFVLIVESALLSRPSEVIEKLWSAPG